MRWLRSTWRLRAVALLLAAGLLPVTLVWPQQAAPHTPDEAHADWLRSQVRSEMGDAERDAFEAALQAAVEAEAARSLEDFLHHFVAAYVQHAHGPSLAELFGVAEEANEQIADALQRRLTQVAGWAAVPRLVTAFQAPFFSSSYHSPAGTASCLASPAITAFQATVVRIAGLTLGVGLVRTLSTSRPRAP